MAKQEIIKHLTDLMGVIQHAYFKGGIFKLLEYDSSSGVCGELRVHEGDNPDGAAISIDLYNFEGDGKPVCDGLTFQRECDKYPIRAYCIAYNPDLDWETRHLYILCCYDDGGVSDGLDLIPELVPEEVLTAITQWLEKAMVPEQKPSTAPNAKDIIALWSDWCMDWDDENLWLDYMVKHPKDHCNRQHLQEKWDYCYEKYGNKAAMNMFWRELDNDNRAILTEYITTQWHKN